MNIFARRRKWRRRNYRPYFYGGYYPYFFNYYKEIKNSFSDDFYFENCPDSLNSICHDDTDKEKKIYCGFDQNNNIIKEYKSFCDACQTQEVKYVISGKCLRNE